MHPGRKLIPKRRVMATSTPPRVECEQHHPALMVPDIVAAADFYVKKLGFQLAFTWGEPPTFAGVNLGHVQVFLDQGTPNPSGYSGYFVVSDADELYQFQHAPRVQVV